jgi:cytoskeleton protein RodZ
MQRAELKKARLDAGLTIEDVASKLNISKKYLVALEDDDLEALPSKVYADGYLRLYSQFLKIEEPVIENVEKQEVIEILPEDNSKFKFYLVAISLLILVAIAIVYPIILKYS